MNFIIKIKFYNNNTARDRDIKNRVRYLLYFIKEFELHPSSRHDEINPLTIFKSFPSTFNVKLLYELSTSNNFDQVHVRMTTCSLVWALKKY